MIQIKNRPETGAPTRTRVSQSGMDREDYGHAGLEDQSKRQWSVQLADENFPQVGEHFFKFSDAAMAQAILIQFIEF